MENPEELKGNISNLAEETGKGYLLEADISYPDNLHDLHNEEEDHQWSPKAGSKSVHQEEEHDLCHRSRSIAQTRVGLG